MSSGTGAPAPASLAMGVPSLARGRRRTLLPVVGIVGGTLVGVATAALVRRARGERDDRWWFLGDGLAIDFEKGGVSVKPYPESGDATAHPASAARAAPSDARRTAETASPGPDPTTA